MSGEDAVRTSDEVEREQPAVDETVGEHPAIEEADAAAAGGEGEALRSFLEVGNFGLLRSDLVNEFLSSEHLRTPGRSLLYIWPIVCVLC